VGATTDEIDREINSTREHLDENLGVLERRAATSARRIALYVAAGVGAGLVVGGVAFLAYRRFRKPSLRDRLEGVLPEALTSLPEEIRSKLRLRPIKIVISEQPENEPGMWEAIGRKVAPAVVSTAVGAAMSRVFRRGTVGASPREG
jgi:hypothetical protein